MPCRGPSVTSEADIRPCPAGSGGQIEHGVGNGTAIFLPYDHGLGHGPKAAKRTASMDAGATGLIFGRNVFQRGHDESLRFVAQLKEILAKYPS